MRESDARFHALFQATPSPYLVVVPPDFTIVAVNDAYLRATMTEREAILGRPLFEVFPENPTSPSGGVQALRASLERVVAERRIDEMAVTKYDIRRPAALGGGFEERWWRPRNAPVFGPGPDGELISIIHHVEDVTTRVRVEAALRESEERYRTLFDSIDEGFCIIEMLFDERGQACDYRFLETNPAFIMQTGLTDAVGRTMLELAPQHEKFWFETYGEIARTGEARRFEHEAQALGRWYDVYAFRVGVPEEKKVAILFTDINQRRRAEAAVRESQQRQAMLAAELQHRVRNIMAIIHSIATRTAHSATSVDEYTQLLSGRLMALARTQRLLTHSKNAELSLAMLVREELNAQAHEQGEYDIQGPEVTISPKAAEVLSLAIHELATNALKYGALSEPKDRVSVRWEVTQPNGDSWLHFRWSERRAHPLSGVAPARRGFGTELIERRVPYELRGRGSLRFDAGGAQCELDFPLRHGASVLETDLPRDFPGSIRVKEVDDGGDLAGADVLILEDDFYLGTDLEQALLTRGGGTIYGPFSTEAAALESVRAHEPHAALLDINLGGKPSFKLAEILKAKNIPFIFITGYESAMIPAAFTAYARLQKPINLETVARVVAQLLRSRPNLISGDPN
jgi:PAS domain S-box-containing protein